MKQSVSVLLAFFALFFKGCSRPAQRVVTLVQKDLYLECLQSFETDNGAMEFARVFPKNLEKVAENSSLSISNIPFIDLPLQSIPELFAVTKFQLSEVWAEVQTLLSALPEDLKKDLLSKEIPSNSPSHQESFYKHRLTLGKLRGRARHLSRYLSSTCRQLGRSEPSNLSDMTFFYQNLFTPKELDVLRVFDQGGLSEQKREKSSQNMSLEEQESSELLKSAKSKLFLQCLGFFDRGEQSCQNEIQQSSLEGRCLDLVESYEEDYAQEREKFFALKWGAPLLQCEVDDQDHYIFRLRTNLSALSEKERTFFIESVEKNWRVGERVQFQVIEDDKSTYRVEKTPSVSTSFVSYNQQRSLFVMNLASDYLNSRRKNQEIIIAHEFGHFLGFSDCYHETIRGESYSYYSLDRNNIMCHREGKVLEQEHMDRLIQRFNSQQGCLKI